MIKLALRHWPVTLFGASIAVSLALMVTPASACGECDMHCQDSLFLCEGNANADSDECMRECSFYPNPSACQNWCASDWQAAYRECNQAYQGCASSCPPANSDPTCRPPGGSGPGTWPVKMMVVQEQQ